MTFWEILLLLCTAPLWFPLFLAGLLMVALAIGAAIAIPLSMIMEALRK